MSDEKILWEAKEIEDRWTKIKKTPEGYKRFVQEYQNDYSDNSFFSRSEITKMLLENQKKINEESANDFKQMKRIQIPLMRRIYPQLYNNGPVNDNGLFPDPVPAKKRRKALRSVDDDWVV